MWKTISIGLATILTIGGVLTIGGYSQDFLGKDKQIPQGYYSMEATVSTSLTYDDLCEFLKSSHLPSSHP